MDQGLSRQSPQRGTYTLTTEGLTMKKLICILFFAGALSLFSADYADIRAQLSTVKELSREDFELGDKLLAQMKKDGMKKPLLYGKQFFFTEPVLWCTSKMFLTEKRWLDQPLFKSREYYDIGPSQYKMPGVAKNLELLKETGLDGFGMFVNLDITKATVDMIGKYSTEKYPLYCLPTLCPEGAYGPLENQHLDKTPVCTPLAGETGLYILRGRHFSAGENRRIHLRDKKTCRFGLLLYSCRRFFTHLQRSVSLLYGK